jgi:glycogen synthase
LKKSSPRSLWVFTTEYEPYIIGGLGTVATNLTRSLTRKWGYTTVLSENRSPRYDISKKGNLRIIRIPKKVLLAYTPSAIHRWMKKRGYKKPDHIHIHSIQFAGLAKWYRKEYSTPIIYTCHSLISLEAGPKRKKRRLVHRQVQLLKAAHRVVVPSRWEFVKLKKLYPFCANKTRIIKHGVHAYTPRARAPRYRLLFVGRLIPSKGIEPLLKAIALLKRRNKKVELHVIGTGSKLYLRHLKSLVRRLGIQAHVQWLGFRRQKQVQKMYASYGAVVMPSILGESFGLVALEALASGVPLIATRSGGLSEIVNNKVAQVLPRVESHAIASAIQSIWNNPAVTRKRVIKGRRLASRYRWPRVAGQYEALFRKIRSGKKGM